MIANKNRLNFIVDKPFAFIMRDTRISKFNMPNWKVELMRVTRPISINRINPELHDGWCD